MGETASLRVGLDDINVTCSSQNGERIFLEISLEDGLLLKKTKGILQ